MRFPISIVLASILSYAPAIAQNGNVQRGPAPDWAIPSELMSVPEDAAGLIFVRRQDTIVHLDDQGQAQYLGYRIKILHSNALQLGNLSIGWNPASGVPVVHNIKIYRNGEAIDVLEKSTFEILRRENQLEQAKLDGNLTAVLRVADLRVGDEFEFELTTRLNDPTLGNSDAGALVLASNPQPGRFRLGLNWIEGQQPDIKMSPDMAAIAKKRKQAIEFRFDNPAILAVAKDAPARFHWQRVVEYSDFSDWAAISRRFAPLFAEASSISESAPLQQEANRISNEFKSPIDRAKAALRLVQQDVRYIYVGLDGKNLTPANAEETWRLRYGDCKGKTALLLGLLNELGIKAEAVLVNNAGGDDGMDERLPSPQMFDHVLVRAWIDGVAYWLDGTLPAVVPPSTDTTLPYKWALPLTEQGSELDRIEWQPSKRPDEITLYEIDARAGFDKPAQITNTTIVRGIKGLQQQVQFSAAAPGELFNAFRQQMVGDTWHSIDDVQWRYDQEAEASVLTISGTWMIDWDDDGDGAKSYALPGGGFNPPSRRARSANQNQDIPYYNKPEFSCYATTVRLPSSTKAGQWTFKSGFDERIFGKNYYPAFGLGDNAIRMIRGFRVEQEEITAAKAKSDNDQIASFNNSKAWIFYDPTSQGYPNHNKESVPSTYDIDWTADNVPCLSPNTAR